MNNLDYETIINDIFSVELPYLIASLSKFKTTKITLPKVNLSSSNRWYNTPLVYDKNYSAIHLVGISDCIDFKRSIGFDNNNKFITENENIYDFGPMLLHKHINQEQYSKFIKILKDFIEIRQRHLGLLNGDTYYFVTSRDVLVNPFKNCLVIYKGKDVDFHEVLSELSRKKRKEVVHMSDHEYTIKFLKLEFEKIGDEYIGILNRVKELTNAYKLISNL